MWNTLKHTNVFNSSNKTKRNVTSILLQYVCVLIPDWVHVLESGYESTWQPLGSFPSHFIPLPNDWMWARLLSHSVHIRMQHWERFHQQPIYQKLQTNCKHPTLLPLLLHITVSRLVGRQTAESGVVSLSTSDILGANIRIQSHRTFYKALRLKNISIQIIF